MKKLFLISFLFLLLGIFANGQTKTPKGLDVNGTIIDATEISSLNNITGNIENRLAGKADLSNADTIDIFQMVKKPVEKLVDAFGDANEQIIIPSYTGVLFSSSYTFVNGTSIGTYFMVEDTTVVNKVGVYILNNADYTTSADTSTIFNGFAIFSVNKSTGAETLLTKTKCSPAFWDVGTAFGVKTLTWNTAQTLIPGNIYWVKLYNNFSGTPTALPQIGANGTSSTRNAFGYYFCAYITNDLYPANKINPTDYTSGLSSVPGIVLFKKP
jgi:hypothetical protein